MADAATALVGELKVLRRGRGLQAANIDAEIGPLIRRACNISADDGPDVIRRKVRFTLTEMASRLSVEQRLPVLAALGLEAFPGESFASRVEHVADLNNKTPRTIRRHVDAGFEQLAEAMSRMASPSEEPRRTGWYLHRLEAILRMRSNSPECFERRTIVANEDGLDEVTTSITVPRVTNTVARGYDLYIEPYFGVRLLSMERVSDTRFLFRFALPRRLQIGESYQFGVVSRIPPGQPMRSHYVFFPGVVCDEFDLRIRFDPDCLPRDLWRVENVLYPDLDNGPVPGETIALDKAGEVHLMFDDLMLGYGCGAQWRL